MPKLSESGPPPLWRIPMDGMPTPIIELRDWFAGQALAGMEMWCPTRTNPSVSVQRARAEWAYEQADAMLEARSPERTEGKR